MTSAITFQRTAAGVPVAVVAICAWIISYVHIYRLAIDYGQPHLAALLLPVVVDFLIIGGSVILFCAKPGQVWLGWLGVIPGVAATLFANVESGLPHGLVGAGLAGWPAVALTVATFIFERWLKSQVGQGGAGGSDVAQELPAITPAEVPELAALSQCDHGAAGSVDEAVVNAFLHTRDCLGGTPSQRQLATRFDIPRTKVATLVGTLNATSPAQG